MRDSVDFLLKSRVIIRIAMSKRYLIIRESECVCEAESIEVLIVLPSIISWRDFELILGVRNLITISMPTCSILLIETLGEDHRSHSLIVQRVWLEKVSDMERHLCV
jgi:hypothetical protein